MKKMRHILSVCLIALATIMLLAHNIIPHHHSFSHGLTSCVEHSNQSHNPPSQISNEAIVPCNAAHHSCSHETHYGKEEHHCDHSLCTLLYEFLSNQAPNSVSHNQLVILAQSHYAIVCEDVIDKKQQYNIEGQVPLDNEKIFRDVPRRAPPVA